MTLLDELRERASREADAMGLEIIEAAAHKAALTRFRRLRQNKAEPETEQEFAYLHAVSQYVHYKILARRLCESGDMRRYSDYSVQRSRADEWRMKMNMLEFGIEASLFKVSKDGTVAEVGLRGDRGWFGHPDLPASQGSYSSRASALHCYGVTTFSCGSVHP